MRFSRSSINPASTLSGRIAALRIIHPFPTLMNVLATGGLTELATRGSASVGTVLQLMLTMLAIQSGIGIVNDLRDRELDRLSKPSKPLISGALSPRVATVAGAATLLAAIVLASGFGVVAWLLAMGGLTCGLLYDLWLKRSPFSGLPYVVALPLLPLWIWTATDRWCAVLAWVLPLGLLLGLALHLANSLPDFEDDRRAGIDGLAQRLGTARALAICWGTYGCAILLVLVSSARVSYTLASLLPGLTVSAASLIAAIGLHRRRPTRQSLQMGWTLLVLGTAALALGWLGALPPC